MSGPASIFHGYGQPTYTAIPDLFLDQQMQDLSGTELKVMLYIFRHTYGFQKHCDAISYSQFVEGITTRDGRRLDRGAGVCERSVVRALDVLVERGLIFRHYQFAPDGGFRPTVYELNIDGEPHWSNTRESEATPSASLAEPSRRYDTNLPATLSETSYISDGILPATLAELSDRYDATPSVVLSDLPDNYDGTLPYILAEDSPDNYDGTLPDILSENPSDKSRDTKNIYKQNTSLQHTSNQNRSKQHTLLCDEVVAEEVLETTGMQSRTVQELSRIAARNGRDATYLQAWQRYVAGQESIANPQAYLRRVISENADPPAVLSTNAGSRVCSYQAERRAQTERRVASARKYGLI
ncbi:MAG TPA: replication protein [Chloroflexia bacterium]|nr:replication protein [Chloroflexia bacterium]